MERKYHISACHLYIPIVILACFCLAGGAYSGSAFLSVDTTPPMLSDPQPVPDSNVGTTTPVISARLVDSGLGIDPSSVRVMLDGVDVTRYSVVSGEGVTLIPPKPLKTGIHKVDIRASDRAGNKGNRLGWQFGVQAQVPVICRWLNNNLIVNNEPFFPIGIYNTTCNPLGERFDEARLAEAADAGFNVLVHGGHATQAQLDKVFSYGMKELVLVMYLQYCQTPETARYYLVEYEGAPTKWKDHPAFLGYWADSPDAVLASLGYSISQSRQFMQNGQDVLTEYDPHHPAMWCFAHADTYKDYAGTTDALMPFFYPVGSGYTAPDISRIVLDRAFSAANEYNKPVWFFSQAIDLSIEYTGVKPLPEDFRPTPAEIRLMNYLALVDGVKGLVVYGSGGSSFPGVYNDVTEYPAQFNEILNIGREVRYLSRTLVFGTPSGIASTAEPGIKYRELNVSGKRTLIAVNTNNYPVSVPWQFSATVQPAVLFEDRVLAVAGNAMVDDFAPYGVHVYTW